VNWKPVSWERRDRPARSEEGLGLFYEDSNMPESIDAIRV